MRRNRKSFLAFRKSRICQRPFSENSLSHYLNLKSALISCRRLSSHIVSFHRISSPPSIVRNYIVWQNSHRPTTLHGEYCTSIYGVKNTRRRFSSIQLGVVIECVIQKERETTMAQPIAPPTSPINHAAPQQSPMSTTLDPTQRSIAKKLLLERRFGDQAVKVENGNARQQRFF